MASFTLSRSAAIKNSLRSSPVSDPARSVTMLLETRMIQISRRTWRWISPSGLYRRWEQCRWTSMLDRKKVDPRFDEGPFQNLRLHVPDECEQRAPVGLWTCSVRATRLDFERRDVPFHGERAFRKRLLYHFLTSRETEQKSQMQSDSGRTSKTAKSFTQDWISNDDVSKSNRVKGTKKKKRKMICKIATCYDGIYQESLQSFLELIMLR